jgi:GH15 family glucan-1,4-alpha-glucosidase
VDTLAGYRGARPVRVGIPPGEHPEYDAYGSVVLAATQAFFDLRLPEPAHAGTFRLLERLGERAWEHRETPDGGMWGFGDPDRVHTHSGTMCWAACDRLARIAGRLGLADRQAHWAGRAETIRGTILERAWSGRRGCFVASYGGEDLDACLLLMHQVGLIQAKDPRFVATVDAVGRELVEGPFVRAHTDEAGSRHPEHAIVACSYWYVDALAATGRREQARALFEQVLRYRSSLGLLAGHVDRRTGELWGNFPQTQAHVGLINCATRLSRSWDEIV